MSGCLTDPPMVVGKMLAERADGTIAAIAWMKFPEEEDDAATAYEIVKGGRLVPLDDVSCWGKWKAVAALVAAEGGG